MRWPEECKTLRLFTCNLSARIVLLSKELQPSKARLPMAIPDTGRLMLSKEVHWWKAQYRMAVNDSGRVTLAKELQSSNALSPMSVTDSGRVMFVKELHRCIETLTVQQLKTGVQDYYIRTRVQGDLGSALAQPVAAKADLKDKTCFNCIDTEPCYIKAHNIGADLHPWRMLRDVPNRCSWPLFSKEKLVSQ